MRSINSLFHGALFPRTSIIRDADGSFIGSSTDVTPWYLLIGRIWGGMLWLYIILTPLLAPIYFVFAHWYCRRYDAENLTKDPNGWPTERRQILRNHRNILIGWAIFMIWGYCADWGVNSATSYYKEPNKTNTEYKWDPYTYEDPYGQYNHYK